jgi:NAD(P)-dependent dehydrogenase (short-subunit alcohol dehydrogenase family)
VMASEDLFSVRDRNVLITGAGRGIGRILALAFADAGAHVAVAGRTAADLEATAAQVRDRGRRALAVPADVRSVASVDALVETTARELEGLDVLINNAGIFVNRPAVEMTEAEWDEMTDTNVKGLFFCARAAARAMLPRGGGRIINVSSALARVAQEGYACYCANKAAVEQLTRVLALEWAPAGVNVNAIAPTTTETPEKPERLRTPEALARALAKIPLGRYGQPGDLVGAALYLASPASAFVTGQTLVVDGGFSLAK